MPDQAEPALLWFSDLKMVKVARAAGGRLVQLDTRNPSRIRFGFAGLPDDFELRVFNGEVTLNARAYMDADEAANAMLAQMRRGR